MITTSRLLGGIKKDMDMDLISSANESKDLNHETAIFCSFKNALSARNYNEANLLLQSMNSQTRQGDKALCLLVWKLEKQREFEILFELFKKVTDFLVFNACVRRIHYSLLEKDETKAWKLYCAYPHSFEKYNLTDIFFYCFNKQFELAEKIALSYQYVDPAACVSYLTFVQNASYKKINLQARIKSKKHTILRSIFKETIENKKRVKYYQTF